MDGKTARLFTEHLVRAANKADVINRSLTYELLNQGADEFCRLTRCIVTSQDITTVADQANYDLEPNFIMPYLRTEDPRGGDLFLKLYDGTNYHDVYFKSYQKVIYDNETTSTQYPSYFTIHEQGSLESQITGSATSAGGESGGECTLTDSAGGLASANERDIIHNTTQDASGRVIGLTSDTAITTALFTADGHPVGWTSGDEYVIQPSAIKQLQFDPPPSTASYTATIHYVAKANPVYSDYGTWLVTDIYHPAFCYYAAHLYLVQQVLKTPDGAEANVSMGMKYLTEFNRLVRQAKSEIDAGLGKTGFSMRKKA